jgi:predicted RNase H-like HicB family nuclease
MIYIFSAMFTPIEDGSGYYAKVPDLPGCVSSGRDLADAIKQITDAASAWLVFAEDEGLEIKKPTPQAQLEHEEGTIYSLVQVDTIAYRAATDTRAVRKNVSMPAWMANLADKRGINVSQVLQESLLQRLSS